MVSVKKVTPKRKVIRKLRKIQS